MNWFGARSKDVSESDLIAYHLHELSPSRERAVARAIAASASLAAESAALEATLHAVEDKPTAIDQAAFARTWEAIRPALVPFAALPVAVPRWRTPAIAAAGLAGVALVFVLARQHKPADPAQVAQSAASQTQADRAALDQAKAESADNANRPSGVGADSLESQRLTRLPSTAGLRPTLRSGVYYQPVQPQGAPPVHLLANAISPPPSPALGVPVPLTTSPAVAEATTNVADLKLKLAPSSSSNQGGGKVGGKVRARGADGNPTREQDIMLGAGGTFIRPATLTDANQSAPISGTQTATKAILAVGAYHRQFRPAVGYRVTLSYTRPDFAYSYAIGGQGVNSRIYEAAGTYVVNGPHHGRFSTAVDAGLGLSLYLPDSPIPTPAKVISLSGVVGASADLALGKHFGLRAGYRAQLSKGPNFKTDNGIVAASSTLVVTHEPYAGIVYRFGQKDATRP